MKIDIVTLFPEMFPGILNSSILKRARKPRPVSATGKYLTPPMVEINIYNLRSFAFDKHKQVDDYPYGGGRGMVLKVEPFYRCVNLLRSKDSYVILLTPQGEQFNQQMAWELSRLEHLILLCGHYGGVDERVSELLVDKEITIGDYILSGGELGALVVVDAVVRLIPGVIKEESVRGDSFGDRGILSPPQYTRPREFKGKQVPEVLLSGDHKKINNWKRLIALQRTWQRRPDLLENINLTEEEKRFLLSLDKEA